MGESVDKRLVAVNLNIIENLSKPNHGLVIHKQRFEMVTFVAKVKSISDQSSKCAYFVDDGTTRGIEVLQWKGGNESVSKDSSGLIRENMYVRIYGQVRFQNTALTLITFKVVPVADLNEITMHALEVIHNCLLLKKIKLHHYATRGDLSFNMPSTHSALTLAPSIMPKDSIPKSDKLVHEILKKYDEPEGLSREKIKSYLPSMDSDTIDKALDFLVMEGHIYTTVDENHFKDATVS